MDAVVESKRKPVKKTPDSAFGGVNERAEAGRDGRTRLASPKSQARAGKEKNEFPRPADHKQDWQPYPVDPYSAESADHTSSAVENDTSSPRARHQVFGERENFPCP